MNLLEIYSTLIDLQFFDSIFIILELIIHNKFPKLFKINLHWIEFISKAFSCINEMVSSQT